MPHAWHGREPPPPEPAHPRFDPRLLQSHHVGVDRWLSIGGTLCGAALE